jgi:hypothetical protein
MRSDRRFGLAQTHPGLLTVKFDGRELLARLFGDRFHFVRKGRRRVAVLQAKVFEDYIDFGFESLQPIVIGPVK